MSRVSKRKRRIPREWSEPPTGNAGSGLEAQIYARDEVTALSQKAESGMEGAGEACQSVPMVKGVDYSFEVGDTFGDNARPALGQEK
ncbi:MAG: hypothetical protein LBC63_00465 [Holophagales bacterium]|nr:hypothetical protein [Holophagales bacterium]